jgi:hypothetical protein
LAALKYPCKLALWWYLTHGHLRSFGVDRLENE